MAEIAECQAELVHIGETKTAEPRLLLIEFDPTHYQETPFAQLDAHPGTTALHPRQEATIELARLHFHQP